MNLTTVIIFATGAILIYSGIKDKNPKDVIASAIRGESPGTAAPSVTTQKPGVQSKPFAPENDNNGGGAVGV